MFQAFPKVLRSFTAFALSLELIFHQNTQERDGARGLKKTLLRFYGPGSRHNQFEDRPPKKQLELSQSRESIGSCTYEQKSPLKTVLIGLDSSLLFYFLFLSIVLLFLSKTTYYDFFCLNMNTLQNNCYDSFWKVYAKNKKDQHRIQTVRGIANSLFIYRATQQYNINKSELEVSTLYIVKMIMKTTILTLIKEVHVNSE